MTSKVSRLIDKHHLVIQCRASKHSQQQQHHKLAAADRCRAYLLLPSRPEQLSVAGQNLLREQLFLRNQETCPTPRLKREGVRYLRDVDANQHTVRHHTSIIGTQPRARTGGLRAANKLVRRNEDGVLVGRMAATGQRLITATTGKGEKEGGLKIKDEQTAYYTDWNLRRNTTK